MLYACLIGYDPAVKQRPDEPASLQPQHAAIEAKMREANVYVHGGALMPFEIEPPIRLRAGVCTTDGPFAETKELLGGYYLIDCKDEAEAVAWAAQIPVSSNGWIDVRRLILHTADAAKVAALVGTAK